VVAPDAVLLQKLRSQEGPRGLRTLQGALNLPPHPLLQRVHAQRPLAAAAAAAAAAAEVGGADGADGMS